MSRYYGYVLITFTDGTTTRVGGNDAVTRNDQLVVKTNSDYGGAARDVQFFPLSNIKTWRWEGE
ncbi:hypothetical protein [Arthrobacter sp. HY1533]|uniref:hypothetical protein n=1 Tax=Arthrobacter sp. HY1533 TaxID=2970919 RepID=UPI0022BA0844|nr:hypothetical protein [Arthrobacter sp. HY1533]